MDSLTQAALYVLQTLGSLYLIIVLLRFLLQMVRADFYNPISQFIVRATHPILRPMRRVIPSIANLDTASLVLALLVQLVLFYAVLLLGLGITMPFLYMLIWSIIAVTALLAKIFFFALIGSVIVSWVAQGSMNPAVQLINQLSEPLLAPIRKIMPNLGCLDLSPIFACSALQLFDMLVIKNLAAYTQMPQVLGLLL